MPAAAARSGSTKLSLASWEERGPGRLAWPPVRVSLPTSTSNEPRFAADERRWSDWMSRANDGDAEAYRSLMTELAMAVEAYLASRFGRPDFLEDCVQESLLAVHRARATYDPKRSFRPWLFSIVRHKMIDLLRRRGVRSRERADSDHVEAVQSPGGERDPSDAIDGASILERLDPKYREALVLTKFAGFSMEEAAAEAGVSRTAMKTRVHRGLRAARKLLEKEGLSS